jgi:hypothetical protein
VIELNSNAPVTMKFSDFAKIASQPDSLSDYLAKEVTEGIAPLATRVDRLEKKLDLLILTAQRIEDLLTKMQPLVKLMQKIPFFS